MCECGPLLVLVHPDCKNENPISAPAKHGDVGMDMKCWVPEGMLTIPPFSMANVRTGVFAKLPEGTWGDIRPRSSTFAKRKLMVMHATIDSGYTGEISVFVFNPTTVPHQVNNGDRLAQLVVLPMVVPEIKLTESLPKTQRADTGFGSTDKV